MKLAEVLVANFFPLGEEPDVKTKSDHRVAPLDFGIIKTKLSHDADVQAFTQCVRKVDNLYYENPARTYSTCKMRHIFGSSNRVAWVRRRSFMRHAKC